MLEDNKNELKKSKNNEIKTIKEDDGFIIPMWKKGFHFLGMISVFFWLRKFLEIFKFTKDFMQRKPYSFVEIWVLINLGASILGSYMASKYNINILIWIFAIYGLFRIFEIVVYQFNVIFFDPMQHKDYYLKSATRSIILLIHNFIEIIFWYSIVYIMVVKIQTNVDTIDWFYYVQNSILCFMTADNTLIIQENMSSTLQKIAFTELIIGIIMTVISFSRFIGLLPSVKIIDEN